TLGPPVTGPAVTVLPLPAMVTLSVAEPPAPEEARASPPEPPSPPTTVASRKLMASPVKPEKTVASDAAPELERAVAPPTAVASPVSPVSPDAAAPELPDTATGLEVAADEALPVLPVLVAEDCDVAAPEGPDAAVGARLAAAEPPARPAGDGIDGRPAVAGDGDGRPSVPAEAPEDDNGGVVGGATGVARQRTSSRDRPGVGRRRSRPCRVSVARVSRGARARRRA